jgi:hypothetical protein
MGSESAGYPEIDGPHRPATGVQLMLSPIGNRREAKEPR